MIEDLRVSTLLEILRTKEAETLSRCIELLVSIHLEILAGSDRRLTFTKRRKCVSTLLEILVYVTVTVS